MAENVQCAGLGSSFAVAEFTNNGDNTWSNGIYLFNEATGNLSVVPEPSAALLGGIGMLALLRRRA